MLAALGESDCELIHGGLLAQPVNALTSMAFVIVGVVVASRGREHRRSTAIGFAVLLVAVGLGSVAFHGPQPPGAQLLHDTSIHLLLAFVVLHRMGAGPAPVSLRALAAVGAASVLVVVAIPEFTAALTALLAATAVLVEVRWHVVSSQARRGRHITGALAAVVALAGACFALGRSGAPTCDPLGTLQFHGLWHVAAATAFGLWWWQVQASAESSESAAVTEQRGSGPAASAASPVRRHERSGDRAKRALRRRTSPSPGEHPTGAPERSSHASLSCPGTTRGAVSM